MAQNNAVSPIDPSDAGIAAEAATKGDLAALSPEQRTALYGATCRSMGLNPLSQPFQYIKLNGKLTLYATRTATDQLRTLNGVSITKVEKEVFDDVLTVTVHATDATGRSDMEIGAVMIGGLRGEALANAHMKALTKAKRRVTLSICGLGWLDESEVSSVPTASAVVVDQSTGEITTSPDPAIRDRAQPQATVTVESDDDRRQRLTSAIHAEGKRRGWEHEHLSFLLNAKYGYGFTGATAGQLEGLREWLTGGNGNVDARLAAIKEQMTNWPSADGHDAADVEQSPIDGLSDIDADRDRQQAAERARQ